MSFGQGGQPWGSGDSSGAPDWAALAEDTERSRARRRMWWMVGGGALATVLVAGIVATAVMTQGGSDPSDGPTQALPSAENLPPGSAQPKPSFKEELPPAPPRDYLADAERDTAPLSEDTLFPEKKVTVNGRSYAQAATDATDDCASSTQGKLGGLLKKYECDRMFRATYERDGLAVTVGVAVFDGEAQAAKIKQEYEPNVAALPGKGVPSFCRTVVCRTTVNSLGRYAIVTIAGHTDGTPADDSDKPAKQAALDGSDYAYGRIMQRGREEAAADAKAG
ncbi:MAG TPA: hypothetical protein VFH77_00780 [Streptomyces sp.]|jgi:hypothetical protein|nr:hypothetical protein [Streptomyces sp.]